MIKVSTAVLAMAAAGIATAQGTIIYAPIKAIKEQNITVNGWGSGTISETDETAYEGTHSIRVASRNFFQGGIINFEKPVNLTTDYEDKANLLKIVYKTVESGSVTGGPGGISGGGRGPGGIGPGGPPGGAGQIGGPGGRGGPGGSLSGPPGGGRGPGGIGGGPQGGGRGGPGGGQIGGGRGPGGLGGGQIGGPGGIGAPGGLAGGGGAAAADTIDTFRVIVTTTDGKKSEAYVPLKTSAAAERGWNTVAVPLASILGLDRTNKQIKSIAFAPDTTSTFYIGELKVVNDTTPIRGEISQQSLNLGVGQEVRLSAFGMGGSSILKYTWDFDDQDGIDQVDAEGQSVVRKFRKPGKYKITLTISDYFGLKKPFTTSINATING